MKPMRLICYLFCYGLSLLLWPVQGFSQASLLFDGGFESGTFQGWTPGGVNGGFATPVFKGSCFSANDTTQISFNGNVASNYAALLRSNAAGDINSVASLRSREFTAGNGVIFSALSETLSSDPGDNPVNFVVNIRDGEGNIISEQPYRTAIIQLSQGCPSSKRDAAFSTHFIDTHTVAGQQISIEFTQHTNGAGLGYFTLIDNVLFLDVGEFLLSSGQPIAVAGTGVTSSGTFYLDPRDSVDPDDGPLALNYRWFIDGEDSIRELDVPCVNLNSDFQLSAGNNRATLYVNDGYHYAADTIRFVIPDSDSGTDGGDDGSSDDGAGDDGDTGTGTATQLLSDPANECDVDIIAFTDESDESETDDENGADGSGAVDDGEEDDDENNPPVITLEPEEPSVTYTSLGTEVGIVPPNSVTITDEDSDDIESVTISIEGAQQNDGNLLTYTNATTGSVTRSSSITLSQTDPNNPVNPSDFPSAIESITFSYTIPSENREDADTISDRRILYTANDGTDNSDPAISIIDFDIVVTPGI